jgi:S1-C subfamily serine protease
VPLERKFEEVQKNVDRGLFLIMCRVKLSEAILPDGKGKATDVWWCTGTGFVIDAEGHLVTCKHVAEPWKFRDLAGLLARENVRIVETTLEALPVGYAYGPDAGPRESSNVPSTRKKTLVLLRTAPDDLRPVKVDGKEILVESNLENDVALLQISYPDVKPLALATDEELAQLRTRKLWPVMVAGFPLGIKVVGDGMKILESGKIESSMTLGNVRKFETFLQHSAPTCEGNSGGPVLNQEGRVVGLVSHMISGSAVQNLNKAVPATRIHRLLSSPP